MPAARIITFSLILILQVSISASAQSKVEVIEVQPATTYYTTRVRKVPNTTKYSRYAPHPVPHIPVVHEVIKKPVTNLTGQVERQEDLNDGVNRGIGEVAEHLLNTAPPVAKAKRMQVHRAIFRAWMQKNWQKVPVSDLKSQYTVVVKGKYDHAERILDDCGIPYVVGDKSNLKSKLSQALLLIVNCPGELPDHSLDEVRHFVARGGHLLTTDWSLSGCLQRVCPGYAYWSDAYSANEIVDGVIVLPDSELVRGAASPAPWKLDDKSQLIKPGAKKAVHILVRSRHLMREDPVRLGILALTFAFGKGQVLHQIGHVDNNTDLASQGALPDPSPQTTISLRQVIALNFVMNALSHGN